jgi:hypothetical protein
MASMWLMCTIVHHLVDNLGDTQLKPIGLSNSVACCLSSHTLPYFAFNHLPYNFAMKIPLLDSIASTVFFPSSEVPSWLVPIDSLCVLSP